MPKFLTNPTGPAAAAAGGYARVDEVSPDWTPAQLGFKCWNYDCAIHQAGTALGTNGTVYVMKLYTPVAITVTNLHLQVITAGATLTSGQNFAALYDSSKTLLQTTADQSTAFAVVGTKTMAITSTDIPAGFFYIAVFSNGTTRPSFSRLGSNLGGVNGLLSTANSRWASADIGRTTTMPATLGALTGTNVAYWAAVS